MSVFGVILVCIFPVFYRIRTEYGEIPSLFTDSFYAVKLKLTLTLGEKCPNTELFLVRIFLYSVRIQENMDQK